MDHLEELLKKGFGFAEFRDGQKQIIQAVLDRKDVLAILPTGAGKTLCYHFPSKIIDGITIVVSPLLSLMEDQVQQLRSTGDKTVVQLNGQLTFKEKKRTLAELNNNSMLFVSPEMLSNEFLIRKLSSLKIGLFVVDEAHCISQWGHEFRTDYLRLNHVRSILGNPPCLAVTATATEEVEKDIIHQLSMVNVDVHRYSVNRPQIKHIIKSCSTLKEKKVSLFECLPHINKPAIIYTATRNDAVKLTEEMKIKGHSSVSYYHGGLPKEDRLLVQRQFINDELDYICATNAFGMGINKGNIRTVIHLHLPSSIEQYVQEVGRAGRDGEESVAILFYTYEDRVMPISFIENELISEHELSVLFQTLRGVGNGDINEIPSILHMDDNIWRMVRYYLEKAGAIKGNSLVLEKINKELFQKLNVHFSKRKLEKENRFFEMERLLIGKECVRSNILAYFGEEFEQSLDVCCSACGFDITNILAQLPTKVTLKVDQGIDTWQEELETMFQPNKRGTFQ